MTTTQEKAQSGFGQLSGSLLIVSSGVLISRITGLFRDIAFAEMWGTSTALAAYVIAFTAPNLLRSLFGEGAFSAAFVPFFSEKLSSEERADAWAAASRVIASVAVMIAAVTAVCMFAAWSIAPRLPEGLPSLSTELIAVMMPYAVFICLAGTLTAVLNSCRRFAVPGLSPVILNVVLIIAALVIAPHWGNDPVSRIRCLALGVLLAGALQLGVHLLACARHHMRLRFIPAFDSPEVKQVLALMFPMVAGAVILQINVMVDRFLAGWLGSVETTSLYFSQRLTYLPVGMFGVALNMVCLPEMSRQCAKEHWKEAHSALLYGFRQGLFLSIPAAAFLGVLMEPIITVLFEHGLFDASGTRETMWALMFYLPGIPAFVCAKVAITPFYARRDTSTPVRIMSVCLALNIVLNLILMQFLRQGGLALATSICSYLNVFLLLFYLRKRTGGLGLQAVLQPAARICICAALGVTFVVAAWMLLGQLFSTVLSGTAGQVLLLGAAGCAGGVGYAGAAYLMGSSEVRELIAAVTSVFRRPNAKTDDDNHG